MVTRPSFALAIALFSGAFGVLLNPGRSGSRQKNHPHLLSGLLGLCLASIVLSMPACGGSGGSSGGAGGGTPAGTYQVIVTGASGSEPSQLSHSVSLTLSVQ